MSAIRHFGPVEPLYRFKACRSPSPMKACRIHRFGPPEVITLEDINRLEPGESEVLVRVKAVGVGPWDAWIRAGKSACRSRCR